MPKITLENTASKGANLANRVGQFDENQALTKLKAIEANLGAKGTAGSLRIIYTTKSNKDLQFETRNRKWWGGLYTPSADRQDKNKTALRELFNKAGKELSESGQKDFGTYLDNFFNINAKGIKDLAPLIKRFEEISQNDKQQILNQPKLIGESQSQFVSQASGNQISEEKIIREDNASILQPEHDVQDNARISTILDQEQPIENSSDSLFESKVDEQSDSLGKDVIEAPVENKFPQDKSFISEEESNVQENLLSSSFVDNSQNIEDNQRYSFHSDIDGNQNLDTSNAFFQHSEDGDFQNIRDSRSFRDSIDFQRQSVDFRDNDAQPDINTEELRANAADALREIRSLLASSLPRDIQALARNVSSFQDTRGSQLTNLRERANEIQSRLDYGDTLPSIPDYLGDLEQLNADIKKFSEVKMSDSIRENMEGFQERIESVKTALRSNFPEDILWDKLVTIFPELEELQDLNVSLDQIENRLAESYSMSEQKPNINGIRTIYQGALDELNGAEEELSELNTWQMMEGLDILENNIQDLADFGPYRGYDSVEFKKDCEQLDAMYGELGDLQQTNWETQDQVDGLLENLSKDQQIYQNSLGEDLNAGLNLIYSGNDEDSGKLLDFDAPLRDTKTALDEVQTAGERLKGLINRKEQILARIQTVYKESIALKEQYNQEIRANELEQKTQQLQAEQVAKGAAAKSQGIASISESLDRAFEGSEKLISIASERSFKDIQERFPKKFDDRLLYVERVNKNATVTIPESMAQRLRKGLNAHLDKEVATKGRGVDFETRQKWQAEIDSKVKEWTQRPFYSNDQKQALRQLISVKWGEEIKSQAGGVISIIENQKRSLQNLVAVQAQEFSIKQQELRVEVQELDQQVKELSVELNANAQNHRDGIPVEDLSRDELLNLIDEIETNLGKAEATLEEKTQQLQKTFSPHETDEGRKIMQLDEKINLIKKSVNQIGIEFP
jgi:hypothetical protein